MSSSIVSKDTEMLSKLSSLQDSDEIAEQAKFKSSLLNSSICEERAVEDDDEDMMRILDASGQEEDDFLQSLMSIEEGENLSTHYDSGPKMYYDNRKESFYEEDDAGSSPQKTNKRRQSRLSSRGSSSMEEGSLNGSNDSNNLRRDSSNTDDSDTDREYSNMASRQRAKRRKSRFSGGNLSSSITKSGLARSITRKSSSVVEDESNKQRSSAGALLGAYSNLEKDAKEKLTGQGAHGTKHNLAHVLQVMIKERRCDDEAIKIFHSMDINGNGVIGMSVNSVLSQFHAIHHTSYTLLSTNFLEFREFVTAYMKINPDVSMVQLEAMFKEGDLDGNGTLDIHEFIELSKLPKVDVLGKLSVVNRDSRGLVQVMPSEEAYFGEELEKSAPEGVGHFLMAESQRLAMELYESRIASMQRFVAMTVMFHQMGSRVQSFFPRM